MKAAQLYCRTKRKFKVTTNSKHNHPISPNLLRRQFNVSKPDQYWVGDITYIPTDKGWLYLATVIDLYLMYRLSPVLHKSSAMMYSAAR